MKLSEAINSQRSRVSPSVQQERAVLGKTAEFLSKVRKAHRQVVVGGSLAKGTWLPGIVDIDVFALYDYRMHEKKSRELSDILARKLARAFRKAKRLHGSRDYFVIDFKGLKFEVVPILKISKAGQARNITDVSPLHTNWVRKNSDKRLRDEVRLSKAFIDAQGCYGAESYIGGFSGYVCEVLTLHYGSFEKLLRKAAKWKDREFIDPEGHYRTSRAAELALNSEKMQSPIILIDPVDRDRNAAAALTEEKFLALKKAASQFVKKPSQTFFVRKGISIEGLQEEARKKNLQLLAVKVACPAGKGDIVGAKLRKASEHFCSVLARNEFKVRKYGFLWPGKSEGWLYYSLPREKLSRAFEHKGPLLKQEEHAAAFRKQW